MKRYLGCIIFLVIFFALCIGAVQFLRYRISQDTYDPIARKYATEVFLPYISDGDKDSVLPKRDEFTAYNGILMYHYIDDWQEQSSLVMGLTVSPDKFESQLTGLMDLGYSFISIDELYKNIKNKRNSPKDIVLNFDDGYSDFYRFAYPILKKYGIPATVFAIVNRIGSPGYLDWDQLKEMDRTGIITVGSHNMDHISLSKADPNKAKKEIEESRKILEQNLHQSIQFFCYPNGDFDFAVADMVKDAGYRSAVSTIQDIKQTWTDRFWLPRIRIGQSYTASTIDGKIKGFRK
jgi:peptidoglycan/xylan/chitin deacetylase (PgdA/CDA1 family)